MTKSAEDYFHGGAMYYLSNNVPAALDVVTNGLAQYPENEKLQKLEALLKQQQEQQQQQNQNQQSNQQQEEQNEEQQPQDEKQQQQPESQQQPEDQEKQDQSSGQNSNQPEQQDDQGQTAGAAEQQPMTPEQALRVLDSTKGDEEVLPLQRLQQPPASQTRKDW